MNKILKNKKEVLHIKSMFESMIVSIHMRPKCQTGIQTDR